MMKDLDFKEVANAKISSRIRQMVLLLVVILLGILISISSEAGVATRSTNDVEKKEQNSVNISESFDTEAEARRY